MAKTLSEELLSLQSQCKLPYWPNLARRLTSGPLTLSFLPNYGRNFPGCGNKFEYFVILLYSIFKLRKNVFSIRRSLKIEVVMFSSQKL